MKQRASKLGKWLAAAMIVAIVITVGLSTFDRAWGAATPRRPRADRAENPHWEAASCKSCHTMVGNIAQPLAAGDIDALCVKCHNGHAASSEVHPIGRKAKPGMTFPENWPVNNGRLGCITCHDAKIACDIEARPSSRNRTMLRPARKGGEEVPFCQSCHSRDEFPRFNPHLMLSADQKPVEDRCLSCHTEIPEVKNGMRSGKGGNLKTAEVLLCRSCHPHHNDVFSPGHIGQPVKPEMLAFMRAREVVGLAFTPPKGLLDQFKADKSMPHMTRVATDGTLTCTSCHNPHLAGIFPGSTPLGYRGMRVMKDRTVSPVRGEHFCNHCHDIN